MVFAGGPNEIAERILHLHALLGHPRQILQVDVGGMPHATFLKGDGASQDLRVAVLGASGNIGRHVVDQLLASGHYVTARFRATPAISRRRIRTIR